jgi:hypothetical protein
LIQEFFLKMQHGQHLALFWETEQAPELLPWLAFLVIFLTVALLKIV